MLRMHQFSSSAGLTQYFTTALKGEYYSHDAERTALWRGEAAKRLGIEGQAVTEEVFERLATNRHPLTDERLSPRTRADRTAGYDVNFHVPKGVSVLHAMTGDERIVEAIRCSVAETMAEIETHARTRVRRDGADTERTTGNLVWGEFLHTTTRPVGGVPDPHLHVHCVVFNTTYDAHPDEQRFKAAQFREINRHMPYFEAAFDARLAHRLNAMGYATQRHSKGWDLAGIDYEIREKFSRRTREIEELATQLGITSAKQKAELGATTRQHKVASLTRHELEQRWRDRLNAEQHREIRGVARGEGRSRDRTLTPQGALDRAIEHHFERDSTAGEFRLLEQALRVGVGQVTPEEIKDAAIRDQRLIRAAVDGQTLLTTRDALKEEREMVAFAKDGRGNCPALRGQQPWTIRTDQLNDHQRSAIEHILTSQDRVILVRGGAGTGKTTLMRAAVDAIEARGKPVVVVAPTAEASRGVLRQSGFAGAETLQRLLTDPSLQRRAKGGVLWCDEAGLVGTPEMRQLFEVAKQQEARVILSGDCKQHAPVARGDALRLLESHGGIKAAEVLAVVRQQGTYRAAVEAMSRGRFDEGIAILDRMKAIKEIEGGDRPVEMARDYVQTIRTGRSCLVVAPTHAEGAAITDLIRAELKRAGTLAQDERVITQHVDLGLTAAQKKDAAGYEPGQIVRFHRTVGGTRGGRGFKAGTAVEVVGQDDQGRVQVRGVAVGVGGDDRVRILPVEHAKAFTVFEARTLRLAVGDRLRITRNGWTWPGDRSAAGGGRGLHKLNNGSTYRLAGFTPEGHLRLDNGWIVHRDFGGVAHGYTTTSHAAQGKSVDRVLISQGWASAQAASSEQLYVSVSRGKHSVALYTDDRQALIDAARRQSARHAAIEVADAAAREPTDRRRREHVLMLQRLKQYEHRRTLQQGRSRQAAALASLLRRRFDRGR